MPKATCSTASDQLAPFHKSIMHDKRTKTAKKLVFIKLSQNRNIRLNDSFKQQLLILLLKTIRKLLPSPTILFSSTTNSFLSVKLSLGFYFYKILEQTRCLLYYCKTSSTCQTKKWNLFPDFFCKAHQIDA